MRLDRSLLAVALLTGSVLVAAPAVAQADVDPPQIVISMPGPNEQISRGSSVAFDFTCFDEVDPNPTCEATVTGDTFVPVPNPTSGTGWDQAEVGNFVIAVTSEDASGNSTDLAHDFSVVDVLCDGQVVTVLPGIGEEATGGADVILGGGGVLDGLGGNDLICVDGLATTVFGSGGNDRVIGGPQRDVLIGGAGNDRLEGRVGVDRIEGDEGNDTLLGGTEADRLEGGAGNDSVNGGPASDHCRGQEGTRDTKAACEVAVGFP